MVMMLAGFLVAVIMADASLTRDALRRSGGRIVEKNRLMVWFMATDLRAVLVVVASAVVAYLVTAYLVSVGAWCAAAAYLVVAIIVRGRVVVRNYLLNVRVM